MQHFWIVFDDGFLRQLLQLNSSNRERFAARQFKRVMCKQ